MRLVNVSTHYGVVVRKAALGERGVSAQQLLDVMEVGHPGSDVLGPLKAVPLVTSRGHTW